ncbi:serine/threonine-protein kinase [Nonomuraea sp. NPDC046802]|uniref:serine/threonine-protein kinase n=1 Tax=Nonomuraea sp. NPDC046802 TaxID=3154919 RepID=UPI0033E6F456
MNEVIGGYTLRRLLGQGGMGEVHLATTPTGGLAALKVIHPALARDPAFRRRFEREVAAARRVARFCTAPVLDAGIDGDVAYLVTEYVKGPDLAQAVRDQGPLSGGNLEALAVGIATALSAIHGAGVIHRDLKPSNVLLSPLGPRVIDFGIAQLVGNDSLASQAILGTPAFMAPEQVRGEPLTPAADVFAWGGVIAYAGTGRLPFGGGAPGGVLYRITQQEPQLDGLDDGIRDVVERALAKDPRARPTAQRLLADLVGGTRLTTATEVVERTWTGTTAPTPSPSGPLGSPGPQGSQGSSASPGAAARADGTAGPGGPGPGSATSPLGADAPGPGAGAPGPGAGALAPGPGALGPGAGASGSGPGVLGSGAGASGFGLGVSGPEAGASGSGGASPGLGVSGAGTDASSAGRAGKRGRRWPWAAGAAVVAVALLAWAAASMPGQRQESWPYEADFGEAWAIGASQGGNARRSGTAYELTAKAGWRLWKSAPRYEPDRGVIISANATLEEGAGEYGVWCHGSAGSGDRYEFGVSDAGKVTIVKRRTGTQGRTLFGPADARRQTANRIVAECDQSGGKVTLRMWLNERLVAETSDASEPYRPNEAGVHAASAATESARVRFDSFAMRPAGG